ncbi:PQQ-binding-like beta-propeller repeat protein [Yinghuangia sp. ASG 101]|uniref:serine/threonine-protein kinase n=1 Tax=Yinghuangia sp. ASG 101 TaxID=2896848 RepID=UPI001E2CD286|nr:serine/threonine-protein kinase [Yinghuangia sp. ASG 101]UGQ12260.1 PQQ-binding-like beta-propeller repeat protein [Yinghuangia sp. ASG 101]
MDAGFGSRTRQVGSFRLLDRLGGGGFGEVYYAEHTASGTAAAVKLMHRELLESTKAAEYRRRFRGEVEFLSQLDHPAVPRLLAAEPDAFRPWLATAFVAGPTLAVLVDRHGPLPSGAVRALTLRVAEVLDLLHGKGRAHRDLTPRNVLVTTDGPQVIDFGLARAVGAEPMTRTGDVVGTLLYLPPERPGTDHGTRYDAAGDVFGLGGTALFAATGHPPYKNFADLREGRINLRGMPSDLADVLRRLLDKDPEARISAAAAKMLLRPIDRRHLPDFGDALAPGHRDALRAHPERPSPVDGGHHMPEHSGSGDESGVSTGLFTQGFTPPETGPAPWAEPRSGTGREADRGVDRETGRETEDESGSDGDDTLRGLPPAITEGGPLGGGRTGGASPAPRPSAWPDLVRPGLFATEFVHPPPRTGRPSRGRGAEAVPCEPRSTPHRETTGRPAGDRHDDAREGPDRGDPHERRARPPVPDRREGPHDEPRPDRRDTPRRDPRDEPPTGRRFGRPPGSGVAVEPLWDRALTDWVRRVVAAPDGTVLAATADGVLTAVDGRTGHFRWDERLPGGLHGSPVADGGLVHAGSADGWLNTLDTVGRRLSDRRRVGGRVVGCAVAPGRVVVAVGSGVVWSFPSAQGPADWSEPVGAPITTPPVVAGRIVYVADARGRVHALHLDDGASAWRHSPELRERPIALTTAYDTVVAAGADGGLHVFDAADGTPRWSARQPAQTWACLADPGSGDVYTGGLDGAVRRYDAASGRLRHETKLSAGIRGSLARLDALLVVGCTDGSTVVLDPVDGYPVWRHSGDAQVDGPAAVVPGGPVVVGHLDGRVCGLPPP